MKLGQLSKRNRFASALLFVTSHVLNCNLNHLPKQQQRDYSKTAKAEHLIIVNILSSPLWSKLAQFHNIIWFGVNDIFKWKTGPIQLLIHLIGNEFFSGSFTHFAFCEYSVIATFSDVCVGNKIFQKRVSPDKSWPKACHLRVSGKSIWSSFDSCLWHVLNPWLDEHKSFPV